ncbi:glycosyltransferase family 4 protein [Bacteriovoracales bacterium]|nr:glycosyltransferase family 4 protein [Bacteriovoracales bacterium]
MKILCAVQFYHPAVGGMEEVVNQLSENWVGQGHEVTVLTSFHPNRLEQSLNGVKIQSFKIKGNFVVGLSGEVEKCKSFLLNNNFDVVVCFAAQQWAVDIFLQDGFIKKLNSVKIFVPTGFSGLYNPIYKEYFGRMEEWFHNFNHSVFLSYNYRDIEFAKKAGVKNYSVIPNGASNIEFNKERHSYSIGSKFKILHVGNHTGQKGHKELIQIYKLAKINNSELIIIGSKNWKGRCYFSCRLKAGLINLYFRIRRENKSIKLKTLDRKETIKTFYDANLFLFPSNIECSPIVLFEAMASKTPFLASSAGNAEEIAEWSKSGEILDSIKDKYGNTKVDVQKSAERLSRLSNDKKSLNDMAVRGYEAWKEQFTWGQLAQQYTSLFSSEMNKKNKESL